MGRIGSHRPAQMDLGLPADSPFENLAQQIERGDFFTVQPQGTIRAFLEEVPKVRPMIIAAAVRALGARRYYFDRTVNRMVFEPDYKVQLDACKFIAAYTDGLPTITTLAVNVNKSADQVSSTGDIEEALEKSPALRERLKTMLERSDRGGEKGAKEAKRVPKGGGALDV